jgi:serine/threonine protein kinase
VLPRTKREGPGGPPPDAARFEPSPGAIVADKYRVGHVLGEGGMGLVVAAIHLDLEQPVAIKFLLPDAARNKVAVERFQREARVAARMRSEYVARVYDVGTLDDGVPYIVMEQLQGIDLGKLISRVGALPLTEACEIALQACEALAEVHAAGIVHRDLKPSNLFITRRADGSPAVKLLDFGISKLTFGPEDSERDPGLTATTAIMGSPSYMSPEQLKSTKEVDSRTDVWSLGAVLFEALTGKTAFRGESVPQVCAMIASEEAPLISSLKPGLPAEIERAVAGCLEKDPEKRILLVDLAHALSQFAPARAKSNMERIQATLGMVPSKRRPETVARDLPVLPLATAARAGTASDWPRPRRRRSLQSLAALVVIGGGLYGAGLYARRVGMGRVRGGIEEAKGAVASAASAVDSVASAVSSAANAVSSAVASALPVPFDERQIQPEQDASEEVDAASEVPEPSASSAKAGTPKMHPTKPKHGAKPVHRKRKTGW